jgi:hypothetical protein
VAHDLGAALAALFSRFERLTCVPSTTIDLEVKVLSGVDRSDRSEPQGEDCEGLAESSGEHDLRGDEQKPDIRRGGSGRVGM